MSEITLYESMIETTKHLMGSPAVFSIAVRPEADGPRSLLLHRKLLFQGIGGFSAIELPAVE